MSDTIIFLNLFASESVAGRILKRQTTYWDVQILTDSDDSHWRISFSKKAERQVPSSTFASASLTNNHPLLINYQEGWSSVAIYKSPQSDPDRIIEGINSVVFQQTLGYRPANQYLSNVATQVLTYGYGELVSAPNSIISSLIPFVQQAGILYTILAGGGLIQHPEQFVLLLGNGYIIAPKIVVHKIET
jgi:hypothetical protein